MIIHDRIAILAVLAAAVLTQTGAAPKVDQCGIGGNMHNCHCNMRVENIRNAAIAYCNDQAIKQESDPKKAEALVAECIKSEYDSMIARYEVNHDVEEDSGVKPSGGHKTPTSLHCAIAETWTKWDTEGGAEGDDAKTNMGPLCSHACRASPV